MVKADRLPLIVSFDEPASGGLDERVRLLGGKAANLIEMRQRLGLRVPPGFVLTTDACRRYLDGQWSAEDDGAVGEQMATIESAVGRRFGASERPLLVAVRSGAPRSMPGMLDTILNVGINETVADALALESGDRGFADDTWLRFTRMYAETVLDMAPDVVAAACALGDARAAIDALRARAEPYGGIPDEPSAQLGSAIAAVFRSWTGDRAVAFREREGIDASMGTACTVQAMVFGNLNPQSGTGVVFTRDPSTGQRVLYGDYLVSAQGEDVVSGTANAAPVAALRDANVEVYLELQRAADRLERHYRDMCDIEFTVADGTLYLLQTRIGRRSPQAAAVIAVEMADDPDFPLTIPEAVERVEPAQIESLRRSRQVRDGAEPVAAGVAASPGVAVGVVETELDAAIERSEQGNSVVLVRNETSPADVRAMMASVGIVTCVGGVGSHAAVVARGWGIPAVVGCDSVVITDDGVRFGSTAVPTGATITIDGSTGNLYLGDQGTDCEAVNEALERIEQWRAELGVASGGHLTGPTTTSGARISPPTPTAEPARAVPADPLAVMRVVQFKGMAPIDTIASLLGVSTASIHEVLASLPADVVKDASMGLMITPAGRAWLEAALRHERDEATTGPIVGNYDTFVAINASFKQAITRWQTSAQDEVAFGAFVAELEAIHDAVGPIVDQAGTLVPRLGGFRRRFDEAREQILGGERTMIASPLADSYHTVWFEFHEELIHLCGLNRVDEERREANET